MEEGNNEAVWKMTEVNLFKKILFLFNKSIEPFEYGKRSYEIRYKTFSIRRGRNVVYKTKHNIVYIIMSSFLFLSVLPSYRKDSTSSQDFCFDSTYKMF